MMLVGLTEIGCGTRSQQRDLFLGLRSSSWCLFARVRLNLVRPWNRIRKEMHRYAGIACERLARLDVYLWLVMSQRKASSFRAA